MRLLTASVMGLLLAAPLMAQEPQPQAQERETEHVVRRGDTLWDLAGQYLANPFRWPMIHEANTHVVADPHWIYPNQVLIIPGLREMVPVSRDAGVAFEPAAPPARTVFYREPPARRTDRPTILAEPLVERVPVKPGEFFRAEFLANPRGLPVVGHVVRPLRELDQATDLHASAHPQDELYLSYATAQAPAVGERLLVAEVGRHERQAGAETRIIDPRAIVRVLELDREVMRVSIEEQFDRVVRGQIVLPLDFYPDFMASRAEPVNGAYDLTGRILSFATETALPGLLTRAFIDQGTRHGVQVGDVFEAYLPERPSRTRVAATGARAEVVPAEAIAVLRVVRVMDGTATVTVDEVMRPVLESGVPVRRVRKMP